MVSSDIRNPCLIRIYKCQRKLLKFPPTENRKREKKMMK